MSTTACSLLRARMRLRWLAVIALLLPTLGIGGCGGDRSDKERTGPEGHRAPESEEGAEAKRARALERIPLADRIAYFQLATASGLVRMRATAIAFRGQAAADDAAPLRAAQARLRRVRPRDGRLAGLKKRMLVALTRLRGSGARAQPELGHSILNETAAINADLRSYARAHPALGALVPE